jgi:hypothetical protein
VSQKGKRLNALHDWPKPIAVEKARHQLEAIVLDAAKYPASERTRITWVEVLCIQTILDELHRLNLAVSLQRSIIADLKTVPPARGVPPAKAPTPSEKQPRQKPADARSPRAKAPEVTRK